MPDLAKLEERYRAAEAAFRDDRSDKGLYDKFKKAKQAFVDARTEQKKAEEADPNHGRGTGLVQID